MLASTLDRAISTHPPPALSTPPACCPAPSLLFSSPFCSTSLQQPLRRCSSMETMHSPLARKAVPSSHRHKQDASLPQHLSPIRPHTNHASVNPAISRPCQPPQLASAIQCAVVRISLRSRPGTSTIARMTAQTSLLQPLQPHQ